MTSDAPNSLSVALYALNLVLAIIINVGFKRLAVSTIFLAV